MSALIGVGIKTGYQIIRHYFCENLERGDFTNEQILSIFESKLMSISSDLEDLKLQKLKSAAFLLRSGLQMYQSHDIDEAKRNFDKAEMDAVEAFSTAPNFDKKILSVQISICAHIWRKIVVVSKMRQIVNIDAVLKQVLLHIQRLLEDEYVKGNVKTHTNASFMSNINKNKRLVLINRIVELEENCRKILFENLLEILPASYVTFDKTTNVSLLALSSRKNELVPFSPRQCSIFKPIPSVKSWRNVICDIQLQNTRISEMISCAMNHDDESSYLAQRKWIDMHSKIKKQMASIQVFEVNSINTENSLGDIMTDFEIIFVHLRGGVQP